MRISDWSSDVCSSDLAYPEPPGFREQPMPEGASFDPALGEFILPYDAVRAAPSPDAMLLDFLTATYVAAADRSEEHTSELQSLMRISYAVFCLKKKKNMNTTDTHTQERTIHYRMTKQN